MPLYSAIVISCGFYEKMLDVNFEGKGRVMIMNLVRLLTSCNQGFYVKNEINKSKLCYRKPKEKKWKRVGSTKADDQIKKKDSVNTSENNGAE